MYVSPSDYTEICMVLALYGHVVDERAWQRLDEVFTADLQFVPSTGPENVTTSLAALVERWSQPGFPHPAGHHSTNVVVESLGPDWARSRCKGLAVELDGRVWSIVYDDELVRTDMGWRSRRRAATIRPTTARPA
ncbi:nuclear transport factor 2 family protein [Jatrophihabitans sp.]|uniref:nuclear transport factor 2 family protein n=1 Tax=Jatrophihabitans sp. TaxID=1932789 RepID=UPI0030C6FED1|nr:hypothetical protein [Jatrophihabitans sp.]